MPHDEIDLRSDTVTAPSAPMRQAMAAAAVGDDVYDEDPTVLELEARSAELAGKQAGLFVPSGSMANLIAQMAHAERGSEVIVGENSHCVLYEVGAGAAIAGVQYNVIPGDGRYTAEQAAGRIKSATFHTPGTGLLWIENTHNMGGGTIFPAEEVTKIACLARQHGLPLHLDGARAFNAAVASGVSFAELAREVDSLSFCLSKGLGAPIGSVLVGSADFRTRAHRLRKMLGGGMRQVGLIAAAGLFALEHNVARLADDHRRAKDLARGVAEIPGMSVDLSTVQTNIIMADLESGDSEGLVARCKQRGLLFHSLSRGRVRFVTHLHIDDDAIARALTILRSAVA